MVGEWFERRGLLRLGEANIKRHLDEEAIGLPVRIAVMALPSHCRRGNADLLTIHRAGERLRPLFNEKKRSKLVLFSGTATTEKAKRLSGVSRRNIGSRGKRNADLARC